MATTATIDESKLERFLGQVVLDLGGSFNAVLVQIGDRLGLYRAMADGSPVTSAELAARTGTTERYVREWLAAQAAGGYVSYDPDSGRYTLPPEQAAALADPDSTVFMPGGFDVAASVINDRDKIARAFRTGDGVGWHEHHHDLFSGTERFFRASYRANLVESWIPALSGVEEKLRAGAKVADVGCGHGASTILMAETYPRSEFVGFDLHGASIEAARAAAEQAAVSDRVSFEPAGAKDYPGSGYDLVAFFDCLHDMGDPVGALRHVRETIADDGSVMVVEPFADDRLENNLNPVGRLFYAASATICVPASRDQEVGLALGGQAGEKRLREVAEQGGFSGFRRAAETPFNLVLELRP
jgi:SAM-dependent methyltransferase